MALADKNIVITPNIGQPDDPKIVVTTASAILGPQPLTIRGLPIRGGTLSFEGSAGQLLSVSNNMEASLFSANDASGIPSIEVLDTGEVKLAEFGGNVLIRTGVNDGINALQVNGTSIINGGIVTANKPVLKLTQTWNNASEVFAGLDITITGTAYHATSQLFTVKLGSSQLMFLNGNGTLSIAGNFYSGADWAQGWTGRSKLKSPGDGVITLLDNAETSFARLQFGGTTSAFPALKRNGAILEARRADDSDYATFRAANFVMSSNSRINDGGDGIIRLQNGAGDDVNRLVWGLMTSAFPAIKRSGAGFQVKLADDSAFTWVQASSFNAFSSIGYYFGGTTSSFPALKRSNESVQFRLADDSAYTSAVMHNLSLTAPAGITRLIFFLTGGTPRWSLYTNNDPENTGEQGSNFFLGRYSDAGSLLDNPIGINRATGVIDLTSTMVRIGKLNHTGTNYLSIRGDAGTYRGILFTTSGINRWNFYIDNISESGSNTGSNFALARYDDGGTFAGTAISISRNTGSITTGGDVLVGTSLRVGQGNAIYWHGRSIMRSPADGQITLLNTAENNFSRLNFGGTTNAFPALKRNNTELQVRVADDSAFAALQTGDLTVNGNITITGTQTVVSTTNLEVTDPIITLAKDNSAGTIVYSGVKLERGSAGNDAYMLWNENSDQFIFGTAADDNLTGWTTRPIAAHSFLSTITTGTAPLTVASATRVDNLNVQYLNGFESTDFVRSTDTVAQNITGVKTFTGRVSFTKGHNGVDGGVAVGSINDAGKISFARALDGSLAGRVGYTSADDSAKFSVISAGGGSYLNFATQGIDRWYINTDGHIVAAASNSFDIGLADTSTRPRHIRAFGLMTASSGFVTGSGGYMSFSSRSTIYSPADGNILLTNDAGTDFSLLQLGGTNSSFPAIKRDGNGLQIRRADDSTYATLRTGTLISYGAETTIGQDVVNQNITLNLGSGSGPGIGYASQINFKRATDSAGMQVTEITNDQTLYEFWMSDNPDGGDNFSWRYTDHQNVNGVWVPLYIGGKNMRFQAGNIDIWGGINQGGKHAAYYTTGDALNAVFAARNITYMNDLAKLPCKVNTGSITVTALNVSGYNGSTDGQVIYIRATSATTFEWGHGRSAYNTPIDTGLAFSTSPVTLSNGITVTFSGTTGAVLHDEWAFRVWKPVTNQLAPSVLHGNVTFNSDNAFDIGASGVNRPRNLYVANNVTASGGIYAATVMHTSATGYLGFNTRARIRSGADGVISLYNTAETDFSMLTFGGVTNSFPAIKRWASGLHVRLADDSAFADLAARQVVASSDITIGGTNLKFDLRSRISSTTDGVLLLQNAAATGFTLLQFGGTTSAFPALKRHLNTLMLRVADDSNYSGLYCGFLHPFSPIFLGGNTNTSSSIRWTGTLVRLRLADDSNWAPLESASITANGNLSATGTLSHAGLTPTVGTSIDQIMTFTESLQMTGDWQDTSINATDLETGTYIVQLYVFDQAVGGGQWRENYSGVMSWHSASTNSSVTDELVLHRAGHAPNQHSIYLRVARATTGAGAEMKLQISSTTTTTGVSNYVFKFRRVI